jgi:hypothetical protein
MLHPTYTPHTTHHDTPNFRGFSLNKIDSFETFNAGDELFNGRAYMAQAVKKNGHTTPLPSLRTEVHCDTGV